LKLFRRQYIIRNKKTSFTYLNRDSTDDTIQNELVKSAELTGSWEKQLKDIEKEPYTSIIINMKNMIAVLVDEVSLKPTR
jgi:DNA topoisomerase-3